jgi:hypothetical protein
MPDVEQFFRALVGTFLASAAWLLLRAGKTLAGVAKRLEQASPIKAAPSQGAQPCPVDLALRSGRSEASLPSMPSSSTFRALR